MTAAGDEEARRAGRARAVALFRYSLIREAADPALSTRQRGRLVRELAAREHAGPFGEPVTVSRPSLDRWIRAWRSGGFDALAPPSRQVTPPHPGRGPRPGRGAETGKPGPHRRAGRPGPARQRRLVALGADLAAPLRAAGTRHPP
jgi:putative transposase